MCAKNDKVCEEQQSLSDRCHQSNAENCKMIQDGGVQMAPPIVNRVKHFYTMIVREVIDFTSFNI